jgi:predicted peptidase
MKIRHCYFILVAAMLFSSNANADPGSQTAQKLDAQRQIQMDYLLYLPDDYESKESWPLMLFLHGAGERGNDLELVKKHGPPKLAAAGKSFPFIIVSPQCPQDLSWEPVELSTLLDSIAEKYKVDENRVYVTGLSMGGFGTWRLAAYSPERFAAIAPICGGGEPFWAKSYRNLPTWVFHGALDSVVPLHRSEEMVAAMKKANVPPKFTVYPDANHDSWTQTYDNPLLYEWMLSQKN